MSKSSKKKLNIDYKLLHKKGMMQAVFKKFGERASPEARVMSLEGIGPSLVNRSLR